VDDLRRGDFSYLVGTARPIVHQIVFSPDGSGEGLMTWRYPYARCISSILITPVPFDTELSGGREESALQLACVLRYFPHEVGAGPA
jgi:hypothetical protein